MKRDAQAGRVRLVAAEAEHPVLVLGTADPGDLLLPDEIGTASRLGRDPARGRNQEPQKAHRQKILRSRSTREVGAAAHASALRSWPVLANASLAPGPSLAQHRLASKLIKVVRSSCRLWPSGLAARTGSQIARLVYSPRASRQMRDEAFFAPSRLRHAQADWHRTADRIRGRVRRDWLTIFCSQLFRGTRYDDDHFRCLGDVDPGRSRAPRQSARRVRSGRQVVARGHRPDQRF